MEKISAVILSGGRSARMGSDKAKLTIHGVSFLEQIKRNLEEAGELLLSVRDENDYPEVDIHRIVDVYSDSGPLAGLHAALKACKYQVLFATACDMPFVTFQMAEALYPYLTQEVDAVIPVGNDGRKHGLCGIYRKSIENDISEFLEQGGRKVVRALTKLRVCYVSVDHIKNGERMLTNLNTPKEYQSAMGEPGIPVFSIVAYSGTGKTTFLEKLIPELKRRGRRVAVVKHDAHDFELDKEGKDSWRITRAGADVTGLISGKCAVLMENRAVDPKDVISQIRDVDVILTEGFKTEEWPKIMIHRRGTGKPLPLRSETCLAVLSDIEISGCKNWFDINDAAGIARLIVGYIEKGELDESNGKNFT